MFVTEDFKLSTGQFRKSPNASDRPDGIEPSLLVIHCISLPEGTYGTPYISQLFLDALEVDAHPTFESLRGVHVSSHVVVERSGRIIQYVPFDRQAWHAGVSEFEGQTLCNAFSIGIELEGTVDSPFESIQYEALRDVTVALMHRYESITLSRIVGHQEIAPVRKSDPGKCFDWQFYLTEVSNFFNQTNRRDVL